MRELNVHLSAVLCMQGEGQQSLEDSLCETRDFRKHKASPSLLFSIFLHLK